MPILNLAPDASLADLTGHINDLEAAGPYQTTSLVGAAAGGPVVNVYTCKSVNSAPTYPITLTQIPPAATHAQGNQILLNLITQGHTILCYSDVHLTGGTISVLVSRASTQPPAAAPAGTTIISGKMSTFGGPNDGQPNEGLALVESHEIPLYPAEFFKTATEAGAPGLFRRLNPEKYYLAFRYKQTSGAAHRQALQQASITVTNPATGANAQARIVDWGPHTSTNRLIDLSPGLATHLGLNTDDLATLTVPSALV